MRLRLAGTVTAPLAILSCAVAVVVGAASPAAAREVSAPVTAGRAGPGPLTAMAGPPAAAGRFTGVSVPDAIQTMPEAITDTGLIVGCYQPQTGPVLGFIDRHGTYTTVTDPAAGRRSSTLACLLGVNDDGTLAGYYQAASGQLRGFVDTGGRFTPVRDPSATPAAGQGTRAVDVNDAGVVVGDYSRAGRSYGFVLRDGRYSTVSDPAAARSGAGTVLNGISDLGTISGGYVAAHSVAHAFVYRAGKFTALRIPVSARAAAAEAEAAGISRSSGLVVGSYRRTVASREAGFSDQRGSYRTLSDPKATAGTEPQGASDSGRIVGIYLTSGHVQHGFEFTPRG
jgi:hypothetical protein